MRKSREKKNQALRRAVNILLMTGWGLFLAGLGGFGLLTLGLGSVLPSAVGALLLTLGQGALWTAGLLAGASVGAYFVKRAWSNWDLSKRAKTSLAARAEKEKLDLNENVKEALALFDTAYAGARDALRDPSLHQVGFSLKAEAELGTVREQVYKLARALAGLRGEIARVRETFGSRGGAVAESLLREAVRLEREVDETVQYTRVLWERLVQVRQLAQAPKTAELTDDSRLKALLQEVDRAMESFHQLDQERQTSVEARVEQLLRDAQALRQGPTV